MLSGGAAALAVIELMQGFPYLHTLLPMCQDECAHYLLVHVQEYIGG